MIDKRKRGPTRHQHRRSKSVRLTCAACASDHLTPAGGVAGLLWYRCRDCGHRGAAATKTNKGGR